MTEAFTADIMVFIEQFRARWPWSIGVLESWLSMSSSSEVPASSILRIPSPRRVVPGCEPLQRTHLQRPLLKMSPTDGDDTSRGRNPENGRRQDFGRRRHQESRFQHTNRPRPFSPELLNEEHKLLLLLGFTTLFNILSHQLRFRQSVKSPTNFAQML